MSHNIFSKENNFNLVVAKRTDILPITHKLTLHTKRKKMHKKNLHPAAPDFQLKKKEKRKKEEEETHGRQGRNHGAEQTIQGGH
jgi:hypothetical protein